MTYMYSVNRYRYIHASNTCVQMHIHNSQMETGKRPHALRVEHCANGKQEETGCLREIF